ncbi:MAG: amidohydrolase family protein [Firmicutes bacterium]|nr:amidohydrolase family protein [Bacillota bacterium]
MLEADWVIPGDLPPFSQGAVVVRDGVIQAVGPAEQLRRQFPGVKRRAFTGCALLPGLINAHTHLDYSAFRDFSRPCGFGRWMLRLLLSRSRLSPDDYAVSALWGALSCVQNGVTCVADASFAGWTTARALRRAGLRGRVYLEVFGLDDEELPATMERLESRLARLETECGGRAEPGLSPHAPYTVSPRLYREVVRFARRRGLRVATHLAESRAEKEFLRSGRGALALAYRAARFLSGRPWRSRGGWSRLWGAGLWRGGGGPGRSWQPPRLSPVALAEQVRALGPDVLAVHCVQVDEVDVQRLARNGSPVAHCPRSNLFLQCGIAPVTEFLAHGVTVGLGTDSLGSNEDLDMFAEMRAALRASRIRAEREKTSEVLDEAMVLSLATLGGARALGLDKLIGSLTVGKRADVIAVTLPGAGPLGADTPPPSSAAPTCATFPGTTVSLPYQATWSGAASATSPGGAPAPGSSASSNPAPGDIVAALVSRTTGADVRMTMVDGVILYEEGRFLRADAADVDRAMAAVRAKLGLERLSL